MLHRKMTSGKGVAIFGGIYREKGVVRERRQPMSGRRERWKPGVKVRVVGEWVSTGVGKRDDPVGDAVEVARLCW